MKDYIPQSMPQSLKQKNRRAALRKEFGLEHKKALNQNQMKKLKM